LLAGSVHNITAQATDAADNVSDVSAVLAITVDTATPTITVLLPETSVNTPEAISI
jgi:hypothetical protein